jgi:hypothetical protein
MLVSDVFDAACMNHVSNTFFRAILAGEGDPTWLVIPILGFPIRFPMNFHDVVKFLPDRVQLGTNEISDFWAKCLIIDFHFDFLGLLIVFLL